MQVPMKKCTSMYIFHLRVLDLRLKLSRLETPASVPVGECTS